MEGRWGVGLLLMYIVASMGLTVMNKQILNEWGFAGALSLWH